MNRPYQTVAHKAAQIAAEQTRPTQTDLSQAHGGEQSAPDLTVRWQAVCVLVLTDRPSRCVATHAIDGAMIITCPGQADLDLTDQRIGISRPALVNRLIVRIESVTIGVISVRIVSVIWIRIVEERVPKIPEENEVVEVTMTEPIAAEATVATKTAAGKVAPIKARARPATIKATAKSTPIKSAAEATAVESTPKPATAKAGSTEPPAAAGKSSSSAAAVSLRHCV